MCVCVCVCCLFHRAGPFILTFSPSLSLSSETACESDVCTLAHACVCMCACMCVLSALARFVPSRVPEAGLKGGVEDGWRKEEGVLLPEALLPECPVLSTALRLLALCCPLRLYLRSCDESMGRPVQR
jgi:hypothetical protein